MSVRVADGAIILSGRCLVDDAEPLLVAIAASPDLPVDIAHAERLHLSVVQVLLALRPQVHGNAAHLFLTRNISGKSYV